MEISHNKEAMREESLEAYLLSGIYSFTARYVKVLSYLQYLFHC